MFNLWSSPKHIPIKYKGPIKKTSHLRSHLATLRSWESVGIYIWHMLPTSVVFRTPKITPFIASIQVEIPDSEATVRRPSLFGLRGRNGCVVAMEGTNIILWHRGAMRQPTCRPLAHRILVGTRTNMFKCGWSLVGRFVYMCQLDTLVFSSRSTY